MPHATHARLLPALALLLALPSCAAPSLAPSGKTSLAPSGKTLPAGAHLDWPGYNGGYGAGRASPLAQITPKNVGRLAEVARYTLPEVTPFGTGPIMVGRTLYATTPGATYAVDAVTGALRWAKPVPGDSEGASDTRGAAFAGGRVFRTTHGAHLLALDAATGRTVWDVAGADAGLGEYFTDAPVVWRGRVFAATAGSDIGLVGHVRAFDAATGRRLWNFDIVPASGPAARTWSPDPTHHRAGGGTYASCALDTATGTLYVPTGNPGPDFAPDYRPGANLYTCCVLRLDARTGRLEGFHQFDPHDYHDWDMAASPALFTAKSGRAMVAAAGKDGYLYGLDRGLKAVKYKVAVTTIQNAAAPLTAAGTTFRPGTGGGVQWNGPAYAPQSNLLFVNAVDAATTIQAGGPGSLRFQAGRPFLGSGNFFGDTDIGNGRGWLTAVDADTGKVRWRWHAPRPLVAALTPTASGLLLTGDLDGNLLAFEAATGRRLLTKPLGGPNGGGVITYEVGGRQYVAVACGLDDRGVGAHSGPASLVILAVKSPMP